MPQSEQLIVNELVSKWLSLGREFAAGAGDLRGIYVYAVSEEGESYGEIFFDQAGFIDYPGRLKGVEIDVDRVGRLHHLLFEDLFAAEEEFRRLGVPIPTEYRIFCEMPSGRLDVQLSRELKYANHPTKIMENGPRDWLGERVPDVFNREANSS
jgi:hypothetical protein